MSSSLLGRMGASVRRRTVGRRAPLGIEPVAVAELISPLRLDIMVRVDFFRLIDAHRDVSNSQMPEVARGTDYETWFRHVAMARYQPDVAADDERFEAAFTQRVSSATQLWRSFRADGYDRRYPIVLRQPGARTQFPAGKPVVRARYMGDGCHRLAMMVAAGGEVVPPGHYRLEPIALPRVLDNTSVLLPLLKSSEADYAQFLALGYGVEAAATVAGTLAKIATAHPTRWSEAVAVCAADGYSLAQEQDRGGDPGS